MRQTGERIAGASRMELAGAFVTVQRPGTMTEVTRLDMYVTGSTVHMGRSQNATPQESQ